MDLIRNYEELANAIILQAVKDYRAAAKTPKERESARVLREVERFFRSGWFVELTDVEPKAILEELRREAGQ